MTVTYDYLKANLPKFAGFQQIYRLRWVFHFSDKRAIRGVWNGATHAISDMAAFVNKTGLTKACIERELGNTGQVDVALEIDGHAYASCQWVCAGKIPAFLTSINTIKQKVTGSVIGIAMLTNDYKYSVFVDGTSKVDKLTEAEKQFKIAEHKLGV